MGRFIFHECFGTIYEGLILNFQGEKDYEKFETARRLKGIVGNIRENYTKDLKSKEMRVRQRAVALYFIDKACNSFGFPYSTIFFSRF